MASAWGSSWSSAWGNSWGTISAAAAAAVVAERRGGAGHKKRRDRRFRGKFIGYLTDEEFAEYLLAFISAEQMRPEEITAAPESLRAHQIEIVEPEALPGEWLGPREALVDLEPEILSLLEELAQRKRKKIVRQMIAEAKARQEEDEFMIAILA